MSAIAGVFHRDGRPVDRRVLDAMLAAAGEYGPDGAAWRVDGSVGLCHQLLAATPEDDFERQPLADLTGALMVTFDGRIDNRRDLATALELDVAALDDRGDAELVLQCYARWGDDCPSRLLGDFAFAVYDRPRRALFCARDILGIRPFYYAVGTATFVFGSDLRHLFASGAVAIEPNEGAIAEYLADDIRTLDETLYRSVFRLPPGYWMRVDADRVARGEYWQVDAPRELRYATNGEYAEHFRSLFRDAVACRLRSNRPSVGIYLSGGIDSSSVAATAHDLARERRVPAVEAFSMVFPGRRESDERACIEDLARLWGMTGHFMEAEAVDRGRVTADVATWGDVPRMPADYLADPARRAIGERGIRVALSGSGGDHGFGGSLYHYADLLKHFHVATALRQFFTDAQVSDAGWSPSRLFSSGIVPLLPQPFKDAVRPIARRLGWPGGPRAWIPREFARRTGLEERRRPRSMRVASFSTQEVCYAYRLGFVVLVIEINARLSAQYGLDERHPFFDRRIVEFALALPESQRWQGRHTKFVVRQAMGERLPASIRGRTNKADFSWAVVGAIKGFGEAGVLDDLRIARLGWVDQVKISRMYRELVERFDPQNDNTARDMFPLWMVTSVELWYRAVFLKEAIPEVSGRARAIEAVV